MKKVSKMKKKMIAVSTAVAFALVPSVAGAAGGGKAPSTYVNKVSDGLTGEIMKVAPKLAGMVMAFCLVAYLVSSDQHKKSGFKSAGLTALVILGILLALKSLQAWFSGFFA